MIDLLFKRPWKLKQPLLCLLAVSFSNDVGSGCDCRGNETPNLPEKTEILYSSTLLTAIKIPQKIQYWVCGISISIDNSTVLSATTGID